MDGQPHRPMTDSTMTVAHSHWDELKTEMTSKSPQNRINTMSMHVKYFTNIRINFIKTKTEWWRNKAPTVCKRKLNSHFWSMSTVMLSLHFIVCSSGHENSTASRTTLAVSISYPHGQTSVWLEITVCAHPACCTTFAHMLEPDPPLQVNLSPKIRTNFEVHVDS